MKAHDEKAEKKANEEKYGKLVQELISLAEKHLPKDVSKKFKSSLSVGVLRKAPKALEAFRLQIEEANAKYQGGIFQGKVPFFNPKEEKYKEKTLIHKQLPSILETLSNKGVDAALAEAKTLSKFLDDQAISPDEPKTNSNIKEMK